MEVGPADLHGSPQTWLRGMRPEKQKKPWNFHFIAGQATLLFRGRFVAKVYVCRKTSVSIVQCVPCWRSTSAVTSTAHVRFQLESKVWKCKSMQSRHELHFISKIMDRVKRSPVNCEGNVSKEAVSLCGRISGIFQWQLTLVDFVVACRGPLSIISEGNAPPNEIMRLYEKSCMRTYSARRKWLKWRIFHPFPSPSNLLAICQVLSELS